MTAEEQIGSINPIATVSRKRNATLKKWKFKKRLLMNKSLTK